MSYRMKQTERGLEAVKMLYTYLEKKGGILTISVHEPNYSTGYNGFPDLIFNEYGIEVKRIEILTKHRFNRGEEFYAHIGWLKIKHEAWNSLKEWCKENKKCLILVAVLTCGSLAPIFVKFSQEQIDALQVEQKKKKWFGLNYIDAILKGELWK